MAQWIKNQSAMQETQGLQIQSLDWEYPLEQEMIPTLVFLPGESQDRGVWQAKCKESDTTEQTHTHTRTHTRTVLGVLLMLI